jgi:hypothetical protein
VGTRAPALEADNLMTNRSMTPDASSVWELFLLSLQ